VFATEGALPKLWALEAPPDIVEPANPVLAEGTMLPAAEPVAVLNGVMDEPDIVRSLLNDVWRIKVRSTRKNPEDPI